MWGQGASPEEDTGGRLVEVLASRLKTGNGWQTGRVGSFLESWGVGGRGEVIGGRKSLGLWWELSVSTSE